jgi:hypothetical protein
MTHLLLLVGLTNINIVLFVIYSRKIYKSRGSSTMLDVYLAEKRLGEIMLNSLDHRERMASYPVRIPEYRKTGHTEIDNGMVKEEQLKNDLEKMRISKERVELEKEMQNINLKIENYKERKFCILQ